MHFLTLFTALTDAEWWQMENLRDGEQSGRGRSGRGRSGRGRNGQGRSGRRRFLVGQRRNRRDMPPSQPPSLPSELAAPDDDEDYIPPPAFTRSPPSLSNLLGLANAVAGVSELPTVSPESVSGRSYFDMEDGVSGDTAGGNASNMGAGDITAGGNTTTATGDSAMGDGAGDAANVPDAGATTAGGNTTTAMGDSAIGDGADAGATTGVVGDGGNRPILPKFYGDDNLDGQSLAVYILMQGRSSVNGWTGTMIAGKMGNYLKSMIENGLFEPGGEFYR